MLSFDKLTVKAQQALQAAQEMGGREGQQQIEPLHLLWALLAQGDGVVPPLLEKLGVSPDLAGERGGKADSAAAEGFWRVAAVFGSCHQQDSGDCLRRGAAFEG